MAGASLGTSAHTHESHRSNAFLLDEGHDLSVILLQIGAHAFIMSTDSDETLLQELYGIS